MTYIYEELSASQIACRLREGDGKDCFTYAGAMALAEYLQDLARETGEPWEMDAVALRCDFNEYTSLEEFQKEYGAEKYESIEDIERDTQVVLIDGADGFIIQAF
jgi:hypothetical protein